MAKQDQTKWHSKFALRTLIVGGIFAIGAPLLFSLKTKFGCFDDSTGVIGDTIGGTTAPIIGFVNAVLLYLAFKAQLEANAQIQKQRQEDEKLRREDLENNEIVFLYSEISKKVDDFEFANKKGTLALDAFFEYSKYKYIGTTSYSLQFITIISLIEELKIRIDRYNNHRNEIYNLLLLNLFVNYVLGYFEQDDFDEWGDRVKEFLGHPIYDCLQRIYDMFKERKLE